MGRSLTAFGNAILKQSDPNRMTPGRFDFSRHSAGAKDEVEVISITLKSVANREHHLADCLEKFSCEGFAKTFLTATGKILCSTKALMA